MATKYWLLAGGLLMGLCLMTGAVYAKENARPETAATVELPGPAATALKDAFPKATMGKVSTYAHDGLTFYSVELREGAAEMWVSLAPDGTIKSVRSTVTLKDVPEAAAKAIETAVAGAEIRRVDRIEVRAEVRKENGTPKLVKLEKPRFDYGVRVFKDGREGHIMVSDTGSILHPLKWAEERGAPAAEHPAPMPAPAPEK